MTAYLWPTLTVLAVCAGLWMASLALEWFMGYLRRRDGQRVSDASLAAYARDELRESAPQYAVWPKQRKGASAYWDRKPAKLRDVSRRQA